MWYIHCTVFCLGAVLVLCRLVARLSMTVTTCTWPAGRCHAVHSPLMGCVWVLGFVCHHGGLAVAVTTLLWGLTQQEILLQDSSGCGSWKMSGSAGRLLLVCALSLLYAMCCSSGW